MTCQKLAWDEEKPTRVSPLMIGQPDEGSLYALFPEAEYTLYSFEELCERTTASAVDLEKTLSQLLDDGIILKAIHANAKDKPERVVYGRKGFSPPASPVTPKRPTATLNASASPSPSLKRTRLSSPLSPRRRLPMTPELRQIIQLRKQVSNLNDRHRKLKILAKARGENANLEEVIQKWCSACMQVMAEIKAKVSEPLRSRKLLQSTGVEYGHLGLELSSQSEDDDDKRTDEAGDRDADRDEGNGGGRFQSEDSAGWAFCNSSR